MKDLQNLAFGVPFDPLDSPEKVKLKRAYLMALQAQLPIVPNYQSPYDFFRDQLDKHNLTFAGELEIPQWLRPKPTLDVKDYVTQSNFTQFLEEGGCEREAKRVYEFLKEYEQQMRPVMFGVDHSSTFGAVKAVSEKFDGEIALVIFDAHSDFINDEVVLQQLSGGLERNKRSKKFMHCGNFVKELVNKELVKPSNIAIIGVTDTEYKDIFEESWVSELNLVPQCKLNNPDIILDALSKLVPQNVYVSLDIDVGANGALKSARMHQVTGLDQARLLSLFEKVSAYLSSANKRVIGLDVMEIDIHLLEVEMLKYREVGTKVVVESFLSSFLRIENL